MEEEDFASKLYQVSYPLKDTYQALQMPIYNSTAFEFDSAEDMEAAFLGQSGYPTYSRISNPTVAYYENRIRHITGALSVTALNSGMAAICNTFITLAYSGANIVTSPHLFGNTYSLFNKTLRRFGVDVRFCDLCNEEEVKASIDSNTCAVFLEIITNPHMEVADLKMLSEIAKTAGIPLIADTTMAPFCIFNAKDFGVDIEVVSSTKYISGGATSLGGLVIDYGTYDWQLSTKLKPQAGEYGFEAFSNRIKKEVHRNLGAYMTPLAAHQQTIGLETLILRYERASSTCMKLATHLETLEKVVSVNYPGLPSSPYYELSKRQFGEKPCAMLTFDLASKEACFSFLNKLKLIKRATNLFDNKTLAIHPASTIYGLFSDEEKDKMQISPNMIRISVGLENPDDLIADIEMSLA